MNETSPDAPDEDYSLEDFREWLEADVLNDLQEFRALQMDMARQLAAKAKAEDADLVRLNAAMAKAGRAIRQTAVLQLEVAGLRRQAGTREPPANAGGAAANQNVPAGRPAERPPASDYGTREFFVDKDPHAPMDWDGLAPGVELKVACDRLHRAMNADLKAAGRFLEAEQSVETKARDYIRHIPHPETDACLRLLRPLLVDCIFGEENIERPRLKTGPPDTPARWIEDRLTPEQVAGMKRSRGIE